MEAKKWGLLELIAWKFLLICFLLSSFRTQLIISSMLRGLKAVGAEGAITRSYNSMALDVKSVDCDYYRYVENSATYGGLYTGEFMVQYSWAESVAGYLDHKEGLI